MAQETQLRIKGMYAGAWAKRKEGQPITLTRDVLERLGQTMVDAIVEEAKKDLAKQGRSARGEPEGLPESKTFFESFSYQIRGERTIEVTSSWPWIQQLVDGRQEFKMWWLTNAQRRGKAVPLVQRDGTVLFRMAPLSLNDAWIHPGFARHTFLARGIRKGQNQMLQIIGQEALKELFR